MAVTHYLSFYPFVLRPRQLRSLGIALLLWAEQGAAQATPWRVLDFDDEHAISGSPAAESDEPGNAWTESQILRQPLDKIGLRLGGLWLGDTSGILSGGFQPGKWGFNSALIVGTPGVSQDGTGGFYFFGGQRIWGGPHPP